jgi:hypothetical protein
MIALIVSFMASSAFAQQITLKKLVEKREMTLEKSPFAGWENGIELSLHVDGPAVKGARKYGKIKIDKAVDDAGTDLTKATGDVPSRAMDNLEEVSEPQTFGMDDNQPKPTGFDFDLRLAATSARGAKTIKQLSGSLQVIVGGEKKVVEVKQLKKNVGKTIDDPALKAVGVTFELVDPAKRGLGAMILSEAGKSVTAILTGKMDEIAEVRIIDASGEKLNHGSMWSDGDGKRTITYDVEKDLSDDMTLQIEVWPGQKTITVPIEMKDVKLP